MYKGFIKRILDIILSSLFLVLLAPLLLILSFLVYLNLGSPILFKQERPGRDEKLFLLIKFRTMANKFDEDDQLLPDKDRLTSFGKFLRSTSLDELPELWCILKGNMSFVGPRPLSRLYLPYYSETEAKRHDVRPGLTGLAQISGRNNLDWDQRLALDIEYIAKLSFSLDLKIMWHTVKKVLLREDVVIAGMDDIGDLDDVRKVQRPYLLKNDK